jgi:2-C-methyl-D-erythritol 4-phosphate cytidylyltransferase
LSMKTYAVIVAGGIGRRMGANEPKQFLMLARRPILARTIEVFERTDAVDRIIIVAPRGYVELVHKDIVKRFGFQKVKRVVMGGRRRQDSVWAGLQAIKEPCDVAAIHDGVRPLVTPDIIEKSILVARNFGAALVAVPVTSTIKTITGDGFVRRTPERRTLMAAQTPQSFNYNIIMNAYSDAVKHDFRGTDDSQLVEHMGGRVVIVPGHQENIKITTETDLALAQMIISRRRNRPSS